MTRTPLQPRPISKENAKEGRLPLRELTGVIIVAGVIAAVSFLPAWNPLAKEDPEKLLERANFEFAKQEWLPASDAYEQYIEQNPKADGTIWFRLAYALQAQDRLNEAIKANRRATEFPNVAPTAHYNLACALALQGNAEGACDELEAVIKVGFKSERPIAMDPDFKRILDDPRFIALTQKTQIKDTRTKHRKDRYRELDFWIGEWTVVNLDGSQIGNCVIERNETGFALTEKRDTNVRKGYVGLRFYDPAQGNWQQVGVDKEGNVIRTSGGMDDNNMVFQGEFITVQEKKGHTFDLIRPLEDGRVYQKLQYSYDRGQNWIVQFEGHYVPKQTSSEDEKGNNLAATPKQPDEPAN